MLLVYFDIHTESYFSYLSRFDSSKVLGESNKFGSILIGLFLVDYLEYKLIPYKSSFSAELDYKNRYNLRNRKEESA